MSVKTTLTPDADVFERLEQISRAEGVSFRQALNDVLRAGLLAREEPAPRRKLQVEPKHMGVRPGLNYDNLAALLELTEGENCR